MSTDLELVVRRERAIFTPSYHVTVASTDPMIVVEAFDVRTNDGMSAAAEAAMVQLRSKGYRLTEAITQHDSALGGQYATAHLARDEREAATVVLAGDLVQDARQIVKALAAIDSVEGAREVARLASSVIANAQALKAKADAVLCSDAQVEAAAVYDDVVSSVDGGVS
ncbi:hypothetical protein [Glycomyces sp. NPDC048151]|uniref:hypothetical protein n=1 Tax=Glycomyces sp. NPDC048151 TaxID=3364002 RepID=UPI003713213E